MSRAVLPQGLEGMGRKVAAAAKQSQGMTHAPSEKGPREGGLAAGVERFDPITGGTNGSIVLMHAGPLNTPKALPGIIANYRARGFTFVTVPELLAAR